MLRSIIPSLNLLRSTSLIANRKDVRDWMFRGLLFEAEAEEYRKAGIRVGADAFESEQMLLEEELAPFSLGLRNEARQMSRLYALLYCFENSVRSLIKERLEDLYGADWWEKRVQKSVKKFAESRQEDAIKNSWLEGQRKDPISFVQFGHLADIITSNMNWEKFSDLIPSQHWLRQRMEELEKVRNFIAHNRILQPTEFRRVEMYIQDWNRVVGL